MMYHLPPEMDQFPLVRSQSDTGHYPSANLNSPIYRSAMSTPTRTNFDVPVHRAMISDGVMGSRSRLSFEAPVRAPVEMMNTPGRHAGMNVPPHSGDENLMKQFINMNPGLPINPCSDNGMMRSPPRPCRIDGGVSPKNVPPSYPCYQSIQARNGVPTTQAVGTMPAMLDRLLETMPALIHPVPEGTMMMCMFMLRIGKPRLFVIMPALIEFRCTIML